LEIRGGEVSGVEGKWLADEWVATIFEVL